MVEEQDTDLDQTPVIELSTDNSTRRKVRIDGELYEIANLDELSISERLKSERFVNQWKKTAASDIEPNTKDFTEITRRIDWVISKILFAPNDVRAKLLDGHKFQLLNAVFTKPVQ